MRIVICDDSMRDREILIGLLREYEKSKGLEFEIAEYDSGAALLANSAVIKQNQILFLDINLDKTSGLEAAAQIIEFPFVEGKIRLKMNDIIYIETAKHKNIFYTQEGCYSIYKKLDEIEEELKDYGFVRTHLSFLINMRYIRKISSYVMTLTTGKEISVPKTRYAEVKKQYTLFKGGE